jgi:hypothetical protein
VITLPRNAQLWLRGWHSARRRTLAHRFDPQYPVTVWLTFADHYEPFAGRPTDAVARDRVDRWAQEWPAIADAERDDAGAPAQWTFFYPQEEYRPDLMERLAGICRSGMGDVEIHIHHDGEGEQNFVDRMSGFVETLTGRHQLLHRRHGRPAFGFIHGNWALDNSRPDGRWCGLNNELTLLRQLGCYADFTMPAAPSPCQTSTVNAIYWAVDDPHRPKSHDRGTMVTPGTVPPDDGLLCVQGPLSIRAHPRWRMLPSLEVGELAGYAPPSRVRAEHWLDASPRIGNQVFVKLFTHGAADRNLGPLLGGFIARTIRDVRASCHARGWQLRSATAWQMYQAIEAARSPGTPQPPAA